MTNDKEIIEKKTGYVVGTVTLKDYTFQNLYEEEQVIFDTSLGNFHLLPKVESDDEKNRIKLAINSIEKKRNQLIKIIGERLPEKGLKECKINKRCGKGRSRKLKKTEMMPFFDYIRVESTQSNSAYDLMFIRFFRSEKTVNCELCSYQFSFRRNKDYSCYAYPETNEEGISKKLTNDLEYYNPRTKYITGDDNCDYMEELNSVVHEFIQFIHTREKS